MRTKQGNRFMAVMTDYYSKHTRAILVAKITAPNVAAMVLENWIVLYGALDIICTDGKQLTTNSFAALCASTNIKLVAKA